MYWDDMPAGKVGKAVQRLLVQLDDKASTVLERFLTDNQYLDEMVNTLIDPPKKPVPSTEQLQPSKEEPFVSIEEIAEFLLIRVSTAYKYANDGTIPGIKIGKHWRFKIGVVLAHLPRNA